MKNWKNVTEKCVCIGHTVERMDMGIGIEYDHYDDGFPNLGAIPLMYLNREVRDEYAVELIDTNKGKAFIIKRLI